MRPLLNLALSLLLALQGFVAPAHACGGGAAAASPPAVAAEEVPADAEGLDCHGHERASRQASPSVPTLAAGSGEAGSDATGSPATDDAGCEGGCGDCCGSGRCGCPCATLAALPPTVAPIARAPAPPGPPVATIGGIAPATAAPPLRPPIS